MIILITHFFKINAFCGRKSIIFICLIHKDRSVFPIRIPFFIRTHSIGSLKINIYFRRIQSLFPQLLISVLIFFDNLFIAIKINIIIKLSDKMTVFTIFKTLKHILPKY